MEELLSWMKLNPPLAFASGAASMLGAQLTAALFRWAVRKATSPPRELSPPAQRVVARLREASPDLYRADLIKINGSWIYLSEKMPQLSVDSSDGEVSVNGSPINELLSRRDRKAIRQAAIDLIGRISFDGESRRRAKMHAAAQSL